MQNTIEQVLISNDRLRPAPNGFSARAGRWQYRDEKNIYTTMRDKESALSEAVRIFNDQHDM